MVQPNWKQKLDTLPVVGNLIAGLRGVFSLRIWREAMRSDIQALRERDGGIESALAQLAGRLDALQAGHEALQSRHESLQRELRRDIDDGMRSLQGAVGRQADRVAHVERALHAHASDVSHGLRELRRCAAELRFAQAEGGQAEPEPHAPLASANAAASGQAPAGEEDEPALRAPFSQILLPFHGEPDAAIVSLHASAPPAWRARLDAVAPGSVAAVLALAGAHTLDAAATQAWLDAAWRALRPDGVLIVQYPNPENLVVASEMLQAEPPCHPLAPARAERLLRATGFGRTTIMRLLPEDEQARLPGEGLAVERLNRLLCAPRAFAAVGWKAA